MEGDERVMGSAGTRRVIVHVDLDAFYASVEQRDKPSLAHRPVVVGGSGGRGVVAAASYEAREFGVRSAMPVADARRRCPDLVVLTPRFGVYRAASEQVRELLAARSPTIEPVALDEAYLDVTASCADVAAGARLAEALRAGIRARTSLPCSAGIGPSKLVAKLASGAAKPHGLRAVPPDEVATFLRPLPARRLPGVGPVTAARLAERGLRTVADLADLDEPGIARLAAALGRAHALGLAELARGIDPRPVTPPGRPKQISVERTYDRDLYGQGELATQVQFLAEQLAGRLAAGGLHTRTVVLKLRTADFATRTRSRTMAQPTADPAVLAQTASLLLGQAVRARATAGGVRLLGLAGANLVTWVQAALPFEGPHRVGPAGSGAGDEVISDVPPRGSPGSGRLGGELAVGVDVEHPAYGPGWVERLHPGERVTVRFEQRGGPPGRARTFATWRWR
jgi:DNA polymerase-4